MLKTDRLLLRDWREADADALFQIAQDPRVGPPAGWRPHRDLRTSRTVLRDLLMTDETYAVVEAQTGEVIGSVSLLSPAQSNLPLRADEAELGVWIGAPYWGRGYGYEACRELCRHGFEDLYLSRIYAGTLDGNRASERMQEKLGFRFRRTIPNHYCAQLDEIHPLHLRVLVNPEVEI